MNGTTLIFLSLLLFISIIVLAVVGSKKTITKYRDSYINALKSKDKAEIFKMGRKYYEYRIQISRVNFDIDNRINNDIKLLSSKEDIESYIKNIL